MNAYGKRRVSRELTRMKNRILICVDQRKSAANWFYSVSFAVRYSLFGWLREPLPVAFSDAAHASEQMVIRPCSERFALPVEHLHQRIENAHFLQCCHIAVDAGESCVQPPRLCGATTAQPETNAPDTSLEE
jgi:hypothetical protein